MKRRTVFATIARAAGMLALGLGLIFLLSFGAILFAFFVLMSSPPPML